MCTSAPNVARGRCWLPGDIEPPAGNVRYMSVSPARTTQLLPRPRGTRRPLRRGRTIAAIVIAVLTIAVGILARPWVRIYIGAAPPEQFDHPLSAPPDTAGRDVLAVGHNAGNNADT